jgi:hypothetical protein
MRSRTASLRKRKHKAPFTTGADDVPDL